MSTILPADPRCFAAPADDPFVEAALTLPAASAALHLGEAAAARLALARRYALALDAGQEPALRAALAHVPSPQAWRDIAAALDRALMPEAQALGTRLFAIPVVIVAGGRAGACIPAALPAVERLTEVLRQHGALGPVTAFGLGNALCSSASLAALPWTRVRTLAREAGAQRDWLELPPEDLLLAQAGESVHLRFLTGAVVSPPHAPDFLETASAIGTWGMAFTRELSAQLQAGGVSAVAIARPPAGLLAALASGAVAAAELGLQSFVSRELRRLRSESGEPQVRVAALIPGALGVRLWSAFADQPACVHERPLHPSENWDEVLGAALQLLEDCRVQEVRVEAQPLGKF